MDDGTIAVKWETVGRERFERLVETLVRRLYPRPAVVHAVDGRGGDGGRDITVEIDDRLTIYQLKYFPEGFSGDFARSRRPQITKSYQTAMKHRPAEWILVYPGRFTPSEQKFVAELTDDGHTPEEQSSWSRTDLDEMFARHWEIPAMLVRSHIERLAQLFENERMTIGSVAGDLVPRAAGLSALADSIDPDWTVDFASTADGVSWSPRAKHPRAQEVSPLTLTFALDYGKLSEADTQAFRKVVDFGWDSVARLPAEAVTGVELIGPKWLSFKESGVDLEVGSAGTAVPGGTAFELRFPDEGKAFAGEVTYGGHGGRGVSLRGRVALTDVEVFLPQSLDDPGKINFKREVTTSATPLELVQAMLMTKTIEGYRGSVEIALGGDLLCRFTLDHWGRSPDPELDDLLERAMDVDVVQRHSGQYFPMPPTMTNFDIATFRAMRLVLEGCRVSLPRQRVLNLALSGEGDHQELRQWLGNRSVFRFESERFSIEALGRSFRLGAVALTAVVEVVNGAQALEALDKGEAAGFKIQVIPVDGQDFTGFMPERAQVDGAAIPPLRHWGLSGFSERGLPEAEILTSSLPFFRIAISDG